MKKLALIGVITLIFTTLAWAKPQLEYEIHGVAPEVQTNIEARLGSMESNNQGLPVKSSPQMLYRQSLEEIKKGMQPYGYFRPKIKSRLIRMRGQWRAVYNIDPGKPLRLNQVTVKVTGPGADNERLQKYIQKNIPKAEDTFNIPVYDQFKTRLFQIAKNTGYLKAYFINKILINLPRYQSYMNIHLVTGDKYYFGKIEFKNSPYSQDFMRRSMARIKTGDVFSSKKLLKLQQRMEKSFYYKEAIFKIKLEDIKDHAVPVDVYLYRPSAASYRGGIGYGTLTGVRVSAGMSLRHLGNEGHHLEMETKLSAILSGLAATYYIPGNDPLTEEWLFGANAKRFAPKAGSSKSATLTAGYSKKLDTLQTTFNLNYLVDKFVIYDRRPWRTSHQLYLGWRNSFVYADDMVSPRNAFGANLVLQTSPAYAFSTTRFITVQTRLKAIFSPFSFSRFVLRVDGGVIGVRELQKFPMSLRFFAGGVNSIRGFADSSIGPGKYLAIGSAEYQHRIKGDLFAAIFYDAGTATNHFRGRVNRGVGAGAVYDTKVGPIKLYLAQAISKTTRPYSVEFSVGPEFS